MPTVSDFLARGYFPRELPPSFSSASFANAIERERPPTANLKSAKLCVHNMARPGSLRRRLGIPNPFHYHQLVQAIVKYWDSIATHIERSPFSVSKPTSEGRDRAVVPTNMFDEMSKRQHAIRATTSLVVHADVSQFYGSLYSHSLPWAIHGKPEAKRERGDTLYGNILDRLARNTQDQQTVGVPIGPDTSLVLAELVLAEVDRRMAEAFPDMRACRRIDDIEIGVHNRAQAESMLGKLQQILGDYELNLNPRKTRIAEQPAPLDGEWVHAIRRFRFDERLRPSKFDLLAFYDLAVRAAHKAPDGSVIRYSVSRLRHAEVDPDLWEMHQQFLCRAMLAEPGVIPEVASHLLRFDGKGMRVDHNLLADVIPRLILQHVPQGHGNDVAWAIWCALAFEIRLPQCAVDAAMNMNDSVVALLLLDAQDQGLTERGVDRDAWSIWMSATELHGEQWLLSYEARRREWRGSAGGGNHIDADENWRWASVNNVEFYSPVVRPASPPIEPGEARSTAAGGAGY